MSLTANVERFRVTEWITDLRLGGQGGARLDYAGNCTAPVELFCRGLPDKLAVALQLESHAQRVAWVQTRCRKCDECLQWRAQLWAARARDELVVASRSWFGTLTLRPAELWRLTCLAQINLGKRGHVLAEVKPHELFQAICREASDEVTKWLKRIRKNSGSSFRYMIVVEAHKSGAPHWHLLLHEKDGKVPKLILEASWRCGFSHFRLVSSRDEKAAFYVCKYLSKSALTRIRASQDYGAPPVATIADQLERMIEQLQRNQMISENVGHVVPIPTSVKRVPF